jgi:hypothetical protein
MISRFGHPFWTAAGARYAEQPGSRSQRKTQAGQGKNRHSKEGQDQSASLDKD